MNTQAKTKVRKPRKAYVADFSDVIRKVWTTGDDKPVFAAGFILSGRALVTDQHGIAWWVDCDTRKISRVSP